MKKKVLMTASVASMIDQFNMPNIKLLQDMGYEVHIACNFKNGNTCDAKRLSRIKKRLYRMRVVQHQWDCPRKITSVFECCRAYRQLRKLLGQYDFEWLHCHSPIGGALARIAAHWTKTMVIYTAHGFHFYLGAPLKNWIFYYPVEKLLAYWTDLLITVNKEDYCFARRHFQAGNVFYIPGVGIDIWKYHRKEAGIEMRRAFRNKYRIPQDALLLLSVGELSHRKNHQLVLSVLAEMKRTDVYYMICGQGKMRRSLMLKAAGLGVTQYIRMPGFCEDIVPFYQNADIFVFPSLQEGMPAALMEAMAAGVPCIASDIRGSRELAELRFPLKDKERLKEELECLIDQPKLRHLYGLRGYKKMGAYDLSVVRKRMYKIYRYAKEQKEKGYAGDFRAYGNLQ